MSCLYPQIDPVHHIQVLTIIGQVFVSLSLVFLLITIITFVINKYVSTPPFDNTYTVLHNQTQIALFVEHN